MKNPKKILLWILVAFAVYAIFRSPQDAANLVHAGAGGVADLFSAIGRFFDALLFPKK